MLVMTLSLTLMPLSATNDKSAEVAIVFLEIVIPRPAVGWIYMYLRPVSVVLLSVSVVRLEIGGGVMVGEGCGVGEAPPKNSLTVFTVCFRTELELGFAVG